MSSESHFSNGGGRAVRKLEKPKTQIHTLKTKDGKVREIEHQYGDLRVVYMDKVDFDYHVGNDCRPSKIYSTIEQLEKAQPCVSQCGIVELEVRVRRVVREEDFSEAIRKATDGKTKAVSEAAKKSEDQGG